MAAQEKAEVKAATKKSKADIIKMRQSMGLIIEELKQLRASNHEKEAQIQEFMSNNLTLHREKEDVLQQLNLKEKECEERMERLNTQHQDHLNQALLQQTPLEANEKHQKQLKEKMEEEMEKKQMTLYQRGKEIEELKAKVRSQQISYDSAIAQLTEKDEAIAKLRKLYQAANESLTRLEEGVAWAHGLESRFTYLVNRQEKWLNEKAGKVASLTQEVVRLRAQVSTQDTGKVGATEEEVADLTAQVDKLLKREENIKKEMIEQDQKLQKALIAEKEAEVLISRHLDNVTKHRGENKELGREVERLSRESEGKSKVLQRLREEVEEEREKESKEREVLTDKMCHLVEKLEDKTNQLVASEKSCQNLKELTSDLSQKLEESTELLDKAYSKLNVARGDASTMSGCSVSSLRHTGTLICPDTRAVESQTDVAELSHRHVQTDRLLKVPKSCQTRFTLTNNAEVQTYQRKTVNEGVNVDLRPLTLQRFTQTLPVSGYAGKTNQMTQTDIPEVESNQNVQENQGLELKEEIETSSNMNEESGNTTNKHVIVSGSFWSYDDERMSNRNKPNQQSLFRGSGSIYRKNASRGRVTQPPCRQPPPPGVGNVQQNIQQYGKLMNNSSKTSQYRADGSHNTSYKQTRIYDEGTGVYKHDYRQLDIKIENEDGEKVTNVEKPTTRKSIFCQTNNFNDRNTNSNQAKKSLFAHNPKELNYKSWDPSRNRNSMNSFNDRQLTPRQNSAYNKNFQDFTNLQMSSSNNLSSDTYMFVDSSQDDLDFENSMVQQNIRPKFMSNVFRTNSSNTFSNTQRNISKPTTPNTSSFYKRISPKRCSNMSFGNKKTSPRRRDNLSLKNKKSTLTFNEMRQTSEQNKHTFPKVIQPQSTLQRLSSNKDSALSNDNNCIPNSFSEDFNQPLKTTIWDTHETNQGGKSARIITDNKSEEASLSREITLTDEFDEDYTEPLLHEILSPWSSQQNSDSVEDKQVESGNPASPSLSPEPSTDVLPTIIPKPNDLCSKASDEPLSLKESILKEAPSPSLSDKSLPQEDKPPTASDIPASPTDMFSSPIETTEAASLPESPSKQRDEIQQLSETPSCDPTAMIPETECKELSEEAKICKLRNKKSKKHHNKDSDSTLDFRPIIEEEPEDLESMSTQELVDLTTTKATNIDSDQAFSHVKGILKATKPYGYQPVKKTFRWADQLEEFSDAPKKTMTSFRMYDNVDFEKDISVTQPPETSTGPIPASKSLIDSTSTMSTPASSLFTTISHNMSHTETPASLPSNTTETTSEVSKKNQIAQQSDRSPDTKESISLSNNCKDTKPVVEGTESKKSNLLSDVYKRLNDINRKQDTSDTLMSLTKSSDIKSDVESCHPPVPAKQTLCVPSASSVSDSGKDSYIAMAGSPEEIYFSPDAIPCSQNTEDRYSSLDSRHFAFYPSRSLQHTGIQDWDLTRPVPTPGESSGTSALDGQLGNIDTPSQDCDNTSPILKKRKTFIQKKF